MIPICNSRQLETPHLRQAANTAQEQGWLETCQGFGIYNFFFLLLYKLIEKWNAEMLFLYWLSSENVDLQLWGGLKR